MREGVSMSTHAQRGIDSLTRESGTKHFSTEDGRGLQRILKRRACVKEDPGEEVFDVTGRNSFS